MLFVAELNMQDWDESTLDLRDKLGWALLGLVLITVAINLVRALFLDTKYVVSYLRMKCRRWRSKAKKETATETQKSP
jgi:hypothetical protein